MSENKKGFLVRGLKRDGRQFIAINQGTPTEIRVYYNGVREYNGEQLGVLAVQRFGADAKDVNIKHCYHD